MRFLSDEFEHVILDLDNTLYDEYYFLESCIESFFKKINFDAEKTNTNWKSDFKLFYLNNGNNRIFDNFLEKDLKIEKQYLKFFLKSLRESNEDDSIHLNFYPGVVNFLNKYKDKISIVTDGNPEQQSRKTKILSLKKYIDENKIFFSDLSNGKSSFEFKKFIIKELRLDKNTRGIVIGDNPKSDGVLAENLNFQFYNVNENSCLFREYM